MRISATENRLHKCTIKTVRLREVKFWLGLFHARSASSFHNQDDLYLFPE